MSYCKLTIETGDYGIGLGCLTHFNNISVLSWGGQIYWSSNSGSLTNYIT
jgi:hypothetical protein